MFDKRVLYILMFFILLLGTSGMVSSIPIEVEGIVVNKIVITELENPAVFDIKIRNLGQEDLFEIYSLVEVDILPRDNFKINAGETFTRRISVYPRDTVKKREGFYTFTYKIRGQKQGIQEEQLTIKVVDLESLFEISSSNILEDSKSVSVGIQNKEEIKLDDVNVKLSSAFFTSQETFSFKPLEKKEIVVELVPENFKKLIAGSYTLNALVKINEAEENIEGVIRFNERDEVSTVEESSGFIVSQESVRKINNGNLPKVVQIDIKKNIISRLFSTFNRAPDRIERKGFLVYYSWQEELKPSESIEVIVKTNGIFPIIILAALIIIIYLIWSIQNAHLTISKRIHFIKTKGGEFALKIILTAKAKSFVEGVNIVDKLPPIVKIYEKFGATKPDRIDEKNKRLEWNINAMSPGDTRVFTYIVYSKIGVVGNFALPQATAVYEKDGKIKESKSNKAIFVNEPKGLEKEE